MSHFYSSIRGQAGDATRTGSKRSGITGYVQTWTARLTIDLRHTGEKDMGGFRIEGGPSSGGRGHGFPAFDVNAVQEAQASGDPKFDKILARIDAEFRKLDAEAPKAIKRAKRRRRLEELRQERARKAKLERERQFATTVTDSEAFNFASLLDVQSYDYDLTVPEDLDSIKLRIAGEGYEPRHKPARDSRGNLIVRNGYNHFNMRVLDLTDGLDMGSEADYAEAFDLPLTQHVA